MSLASKKKTASWPNLSITTNENGTWLSTVSTKLFRPTLLQSRCWALLKTTTSKMYLRGPSYWLLSTLPGANLITQMRTIWCSKWCCHALPSNFQPKSKKSTGSMSSITMLTSTMESITKMKRRPKMRIAHCLQVASLPDQLRKGQKPECAPGPMTKPRSLTASTRSIYKVSSTSLMKATIQSTQPSLTRET